MCKGPEKRNRDSVEQEEVECIQGAVGPGCAGVGPRPARATVIQLARITDPVLRAEEKLPASFNQRNDARRLKGPLWLVLIYDEKIKNIPSVSWKVTLGAMKGNK